MENIAEGIRESIHTKTRLKQVIINKGGAITDTTPFEKYPDILDAIETGSSGEAIEISTPEELQNLLTTDNIGKFFKYTGETTDKYVQDAIYVVQDTEDPIIKEGKNKSEEYLEDIKDTLIEKGVATEETDSTELNGVIQESSFLKTLLDTTKSAAYLFSNYKGTSIEGLIKSSDTSNVENMAHMFKGCSNLETIPQLDTSKNQNCVYMFSDCKNLITIPSLDLLKNTNTTQMFNNCIKLTNLTIYNNKLHLQIGSGSTWGHLLTLDSLVNTCKECINVNASRTLTIGTANLEKLSTVYVKLTGAAEEDEANPKLPCEVCTSTDEGAMLISDYMALKQWTLA